MNSDIHWSDAVTFYILPRKFVYVEFGCFTVRFSSSSLLHFLLPLLDSIFCFMKKRNDYDCCGYATWLIVWKWIVNMYSFLAFFCIAYRVVWQALFASAQNMQFYFLSYQILVAFLFCCFHVILLTIPLLLKRIFDVAS